MCNSREVQSVDSLVRSTYFNCPSGTITHLCVIKSDCKNLKDVKLNKKGAIDILDLHF